ncbi:MAG: hypothetical protein QM691_14440 [Opitutaceae bacterium]
MIRLPQRLATVRPPLWFLLLTALALANLLRQWSAPILDRHEFRQTQTALTAHWLREDGWSLAYPLPVFGPPWSAPMEFPLYQAMVAGVSKLAGCGIESAGRVVAIAAFFAALPALAGLLASAGFSPRTRWFALGCVLLTPVYLFYARTVLIETTALCLALWFLHSFVRGLEPAPHRWWWSGAALMFGALAALVKVTTFAPVLLMAAVPAGAALLRLWRNKAGRRTEVPALLLAAALPTVVAFVAGGWWVEYADTVKAANPFAVRLQSAHLYAWNFGTLAQRLDPAAWRTFAVQTGYTTCRLVPGLLALAALVFAPRRHRWATLLAVAAFLVGPLCFFSLYLVHDYYFCANAVFFAAALGLALGGLWENPRVPRWAAFAVAVAVGGLQTHGFVRGLGYYFTHTPPEPPALAAAIRAAVPEDGVVLLVNKGWNPELPFYMQRRAVMLPDGFHNDLAALDDVLNRLPPEEPRALVWRGTAAIPVELHGYLFDELGFDRTPVATDGENTLFVRTGRTAATRDRLAESAVPRLSFAGPPVAASPAAETFRTFPSPIGGDSAICRPAPVWGRSLYGLSIARNGDRDCIVAHAPSQLVLVPPQGARAVQVEFGLGDECVLPDTRSDGVVVSIHTTEPGRPRRTLYRRALDPVANPADRGVQTARIELPRDGRGSLVLEASTGVTGNLAYDWFYWYRIVVE